MTTMKTHFRQQYSEKGQAVVLMALMMVGLLGALGLAVDGGGYFFMWRDAMNAADAAALSASYAHCTNGDMVSAGKQAAAENGFFNEDPTSVDVNYPPTLGQAKGDPRYVEVVIETVKPAYFIQLVYREPLRITASAVGICIPEFDPTTVPALWGGSTVCEPTVKRTGATTTIKGGVFSNYNFDVKGSDLTVHAPIDVVGDVESGNGGKLSFEPPDYIPNTNASVRKDPLNLDFGAFAPGGAYANQAEKYKSIMSLADDQDFQAPKPNKAATWNPSKRVLEGMYYVDGNIDIGNGVTFGPEGVSLIATGYITASGGIDADYYINGILAFSNQKTGCGENAVALSGSLVDLYGVIYAPRGGVNIAGSTSKITGAIVADTIDLSGSWLELIYDPTILPPIPPMVQVVE